MIFWTLFGVLTLTGVTDAETTDAPTDEDLRLTYRLFDYLLHVDHPIKDSTGYERLHQVMNKTAEVLEFFESLSDLYRNGTLGECAKTGDGCNQRINTNQSRFNAEFGRFLMGDKKANIDTEFAEDMMPRWNPDDFFDYYSGRFWLATIFNRTFDSYNYLQADFASKLLGMSSITPSPRWHCYDYEALEAGFDPSQDDVVLRSLATLMAPNCEDNRTTTDYAADVQNESERFAKKHGLNGGYTNRCFAKFFIRYHNYSADAYERFVNILATCLYRDTILHGLCVPFSPYYGKIGEAERTRRKEWVERTVGIIATGILEARTVLDETPPTEATRTANPAYQTWLINGKAAAEAAIGTDDIPYPTPNLAFRLYKGIYGQIVAQLKRVALEAKHISGLMDTPDEPCFDVLVYYPAYDSTEHCVKNASDDILHGSVKNVNYVVSMRTYPNANSTQKINSEMEKSFKKSTKADQCERIIEISANMANGRFRTGGLRALASIKCARKFVWYELAYNYFQAAYTEAPKIVVDPDSKYSDNCGMLVLFP